LYSPEFHLSNRTITLKIRENLCHWTLKIFVLILSLIAAVVLIVMHFSGKSKEQPPLIDSDHSNRRLLLHGPSFPL
jgi:hypothetical protein